MWYNEGILGGIKRHTPIRKADTRKVEINNRMTVRKWTDAEREYYMSLPKPKGKAPVIVDDNPKARKEAQKIG